MMNILYYKFSSNQFLESKHTHILYIYIHIYENVYMGRENHTKKTTSIHPIYIYKYMIIYISHAIAITVCV